MPPALRQRRHRYYLYMKKVFILNKREGETPLERIEIFRAQNLKKNNLFKDIKMTYAGRLDPMASGLLIVLVGEETKNKQKYLNLDKVYKFEVLFGFATDTYDILGKVVNIKKIDIDRKDLDRKILENLNNFVGKFKQSYPLYSSKTVRGKQLFEYGRSGESVELPDREVEVYSLRFLKLRKINNKKVLVNIEGRVGKVKGDFRQTEILKIWSKYLLGHRMSKSSFYVGSFEVKCSSGTYVRGIANTLGEMINIPSLAFSIKRKKVGKWSL